MLSYQTVASFEKQCEIKKDLEFGIVLRIEINKFKHEKNVVYFWKIKFQVEAEFEFETEFEFEFQTVGIKNF